MFNEASAEYDKSGRLRRGLLTKFLIDLVPGFCKTFCGLVGSLFQLLLNLLSDVFLLDLLDHLSNPLLDLLADLFGGVPDSFEHAGIVRRFSLGKHERT